MINWGLETISKMPWIPWSTAIKKRAIRYLLQRYVGQFLEEKLSLDQLTVDLYNGTGTVQNLTIDVMTLNEVADQVNLPFRFVDGFIGEIFVTVPWQALLSESCYLEVSRVMLTIEPKQRVEDVSMLDSMIDSMTTSMQIAQECLSSTEDTGNENKDPSQLNEGIEHFAVAIDSVLNRIKMRFTDIVVRLEHNPIGSLVGVALEVRILKVDYFDEAGVTANQMDGEKVYEPTAFACKKFRIEGVNFYTDEFSTKKSAVRSHSNRSSSEDNSPPNVQDSDMLASSVDVSQQTNAENIGCGGESNCKESHKLSDNLNATTNDPILFGKLTDAQEISLRLKNADVVGPKVDFKITCGALVIFLSPRQLHLLLELSEGVASPSQLGCGSLHARISSQNLVSRQKPMDVNDYRKVENELQKELQSGNCHRSSHILSDHWSSPLEAGEEEFVPMGANALHDMSSSHMSGITDMDSSFGSNMSSSTIREKPRTQPRLCRKVSHEMSNDPSSVVSHFRLQLSGVTAVLLHEDLLTPALSVDGVYIASRASMAELQSKATKFLALASDIILTGGRSQNDFNECRLRLSDACPLSHLRLVASLLSVEGSERHLSNRWEADMNVTLGSAEMLECLVNASAVPVTYDFCELFSFMVLNEEQQKAGTTLPVEPKLKMLIQQSQNTTQMSRAKRSSMSKVDVKIFISECVSELDLSILDRISCSLQRQQICRSAGTNSFNPLSTLSEQMCFDQAIDTASVNSSMRLSASLACSGVKVRLRFPIPDLRPASNMDRLPWWKKNVRREILILSVTEFKLGTTLDPHLPHTVYEISGGTVHVMFQESSEDALMSLICITSGPGADTGFDTPHLTLTVSPVKSWLSLEDEPPHQHDIMAKSVMGFLDEVPANEEPTPFRRRKLAKQQSVGDDAEELTIPADKEDVLEFMETTLKSVRVQLDLHLPEVQLVLPSKHIYELVYNRLVTDLLLWETYAPKMPLNRDNFWGPPDSFNLTSAFCQGMPQFSMCQSIRGGDSDDSDSDAETQFFSVYEHKARLKQKLTHQHLEEPIKRFQQTDMSVKCSIGHAIASFHTPYRDSKNNVLPSRHGEVCLIIEQGTVFTAVGYQGSPNLGYTCIWSEKCHMYHKALNPTVSQMLLLDPSFPISSSHLNAVLYPSDPGVVTKLGTGTMVDGDNTHDQLNIAIKTDLDLENNLKTIVFAGSVRGATLRLTMSQETESWVTQLRDMFDVQDYPVAGYIMPDVVTEMNFHLWSCALDYRPLYLPLRMMITVDSVAVATNLTLASNSSVLHFVIEDAALFLSNKLSARTVDLQRNYVCVADVGLFELCLRLIGDSTPADYKKPRFDLTASNNVIHVRTCVDSCKALMELMIYLASDGDLTEETTDVDNCFAGKFDSELWLGLLADTPARAEIGQQTEVVTSMLDDAMQESTSPECDDENDDVSDRCLNHGVEVFFFPDENARKINCGSTKPVQPDLMDKFEPVGFRDPMTTATESELHDALNDIVQENISNESTSGTDEEFCILEDTPGTGIKSPSGEPKVRRLTQQPVLVVDNHFSIPIGKTDQLKAPKHFPPPVMKYTLQELTVVWHLYGGTDLHQVESTDGMQRHVTIQDKNSLLEKGKVTSLTNTNTRVTFNARDGAVTRNSPVSFQKSPPQSPQQQARYAWQAVGGQGRKHDVHMELQLGKVRIQHEVYPENSVQASRYVLLIHDVEIRDRLACSKINKFLYQYSSELCPRQAHANMVSVKVMCSRPEGLLNGVIETSVKMALQPIRLHVDQDALMFLVQFYEELMVSDRDAEFGTEELPALSPLKPPIMTVNKKQAATINRKLNLNSFDEKLKRRRKQSLEAGDNSPPYFKSFVFSPEVPIKIDYHGKYVDMNFQYGPLAGLIIGLGQLNQSEIVLKSLVNKSGILGLDKLVGYAVNEWVGDIRRSQLPSVLSGVGPFHSIGQLLSGVRDLFLLPIEQYQRDGRVVRGLQRGAASFTTSSAHAALDLTGRFVGCIQSAAEMMYDVVSSGPSVRDRSYRRARGGGQPQDIREGMTTAYGLVRDGLEDTASALVNAASSEHQHKGVSGAIGGVLRQIPSSVVQPIILASEAAGTLLGGMKNQLVPDARKEAADKWK